MDIISNISTVASNFSMHKVATAIGTAILGKVLDQAEEGGEDMLKLLEQSANPDLGANFDAIA
ncbi:hypothetical protein BXO88_07215 [Oribacterium sp. C9]|uniref:putative motility protein n=1 Tax=Oribacterium sp. C9 TaxID=1943579 RepID=UPI00098EC0D9|nr:putative motility protein [Oribacterium sp. C9]OON86538.1 hypothetical protein BXO88_07215 [Oribacterium sp. C9]